MAVIFYEGNNATQTDWAPLTTELAQQYDLKDGGPVPNDEARSCTIVDAAKGSVIRVYDSPDASTSDDWAEIVMTQDVSSPIVVPSFEVSATYGGAVQVTYHKNNGLDGKVSNIQITPGS